MSMISTGKIGLRNCLCATHALCHILAGQFKMNTPWVATFGTMNGKKFFHFINFPDRETMQQIVDVHFPGVKQDMVKEAMEIFFDVRKVPGLKKKPSTSELIDWLKLLMADDIPDEILTNRDASKAIPPLYGALVKNEQDVHLLERLAFMNRRDSRG